MEKIGVTAGGKYYDLDAYACIIAYTELLKMEGKEADAIVSGSLNSSVTEEIKEWDTTYVTSPAENTNYTYVIMDVSEPNDIADFADRNKIVEIYDHHPGYENYWKDRIGGESKIEKLGAAATLIWEEFKNRGKENEISRVSARLLYGAIVSNTLNFKASITNARDISAFEELSKIVELPDNWVEKYFRDQEEFIHKNPRESVENDVKVLTFENLGKEIVIGQIELWNSRDFVVDNKDLIEMVMESFENENWFFTAPSISEGKNYLLAKNPEIKKLLTTHFGAEFNNEMGEMEQLFLRKEFVAKLLKL